MSRRSGTSFGCGRQCRTAGKDKNCGQKGTEWHVNREGKRRERKAASYQATMGKSMRATEERGQPLPLLPISGVLPIALPDSPAIPLVFPLTCARSQE
jgi:hypothetical protein